MQIAKKYAVITADDFGKSSAVNEAIAFGHENGILSAASIMVSGNAFDESIRIAQKYKKLSIGLHVTLCDGKSILSRSEIPDLVDAAGSFCKSPSYAWIRYTNPALHRQLEAEIEAQFDYLINANMQPDHVDSHHHLHMHPALCAIICRQAARRGIRSIRIPHEPMQVFLRALTLSRGVMPFLEWAVFKTIRKFNVETAELYGLDVLPSAYGLARTGHVDEKNLLNVIRYLPQKAEIFLHPDISTDRGQKELEALTSKAVKIALESLDISVLNRKEMLNLKKDCL